jgi:hypothetical protein
MKERINMRNADSIKLIACKGCSVSDQCPLIGQNEINQICPCTDCIIKVMCKNQCEEYNIFEQGYYSNGDIYN